VKKLLLLLMAAGLFCLVFTYTPAFSQQDQGAKQDAKDAGHATKEAVKKTGSAVKKGTKKGVSKSAKAVRKAAGKVEEKTQDNK
jgi:hypothetical protein